MKLTEKVTRQDRSNKTFASERKKILGPIYFFVHIDYNLAIERPISIIFYRLIIKIIFL